MRVSTLAALCAAAFLITGCGGHHAAQPKVVVVGVSGLSVQAHNITAKSFLAQWTPLPGGIGYAYYRDGARIANTWNAATTSVTFGIPDGNTHTYTVQEITELASGTVTLPTQPTTTTTPTTTTPTSTVSTTTVPATTTQPTTTTPTPLGLANLQVSLSGNDSCTRTSLTSLPLDPSHVCKTWDRANALAQGGDTVAVMGGNYPSDGQTRLDPATDSLLLINDTSRTSDATFVCGDGQPVTTQGRYLLFVTQHLTISGSCFHFHKVIMGDYVTGYFPASKVCTNETITGGAQMQIFDILGPCNSPTIRGDKIGPSIACYAPGSGPGSCQNLAVTGEDYYFQRGIGNNDCCTEPKVHAGGWTGSILPQNVVIDGNTFDLQSSRDPDNGPHAGCLWTGDGVRSIQITNNTFTRCMTYNVLMNDSSTHDDIEGNAMSTPKDAIRALSDPNAIKDEPQFQDVQSKCSGGPVTVTDIIRNNSGMTGWFLDPSCGNSYSGRVISGNTPGPNGFTAGTNPGQPFNS